MVPKNTLSDRKCRKMKVRYEELGSPSTLIFIVT